MKKYRNLIKASNKNWDAVKEYLKLIYNPK